MEIKPFVGFDDIKFGLTQRNVINAMGKDYKEEKEAFPDNSKQFTLFYDRLGCAFTFSSDFNYKLDSITFYATEFTIFELSIIGLPEIEFVEAVKEKIKDLELEDHFIDLNSKDYVSESNGMSIWIQDDFVDSITIFPLYSEDGESIIWPS